MPKLKTKSKPTQEEKPEALRPYLFHGVDLDWGSSDQAISECPFCGKEDKFHVSVDKGFWKCFTCDKGEGGNSTKFLQELWKDSLDATPISTYEKLSESRGISTETLIEWELAFNPVNEKWVVPGWTVKGNLLQLYKYTTIKGKKRLLATPTKSHPHCLFGIVEKVKAADTVFICEGPWDAMALYEALKDYKIKKGEIEDWYDAAVMGIPGANVFKEPWCSLLSGKEVIIMMDNDHPKVNEQTGKEMEPVGLKGTKRVVKILSSDSNPPSEIKYLNCGPAGFDPNLPSGTDIRDFLNDGKGRE